VTDPAAARGDLLAAVEAAAANGVDVVQVRDRSLGGRALLEHAEAVGAAARRGARARGAAVRVVVNRRVDVALAAGADGAHLGYDAMPAEVARALLGPAAWIGASLHAVEEVLALVGAPLTYVHLAPVFAPLSKPSQRPPLGLAALRRAAAGPLPVLAQGGVTAANAAACLAAGAAGVAVTGEILLAADPAAATRTLRLALDRGRGSMKP
jgi:thiamine-phosphate pyrophosphorylase